LKILNAGGFEAAEEMTMMVKKENCEARLLINLGGCGSFCVLYSFFI